MAKRKPELHDIEVVFFYLYDAGRSIDLAGAASVLRSDFAMAAPKGRDTPDTISLPRPLALELGKGPMQDGGSYSAQAKLYEDGAVTIVLRRRLRCAVEGLHSIRTLPFGDQGGDAATYAALAFDGIHGMIAHLIDRKGYADEIALRSYAAFCVLDEVGDPGAFIAEHSKAIGALLIGESGYAGIHDSQVANTLGNPFSFRVNELAVFDFDRCLIIDPEGGYEDLLLVAEHANYQLLELRQLDTLLDKRLDVAEADMRSVFARKRGFTRYRSFGLKFAEIQALGLDALFILENLENSSKIIGDYHLGRVYSHLCGILNTAGWRWSVERRLETLQRIYELARGDVNNRTMIVLEVVFILVCVFQVFQYFLF